MFFMKQILKNQNFQKFSDHSEIVFCFTIHEKLNKSCPFEKKIFALNDFLYKNPELGYEEVKSHKEITKLISNNISSAKIKKVP